MEKETWIIIGVMVGVIAVVLLCLSLARNRNILSSLDATKIADLKTVKNVLGVYYLPETWLKIESQVFVEIRSNEGGEVLSAKVTQQSFKLATQTRADTATGYVLQYDLNEFSNIEVNVTIGETGLLETTKIVSDDQTAKIISLVASAPAAVIQSATTKHVAGLEDNAPKAIITVQKFEAAFELKAWSSVGKALEIDWALPVTVNTKSVHANFKVTSTVGALAARSASTAANADNYAGLVFRTRTNATITIGSVALATAAMVSNISLLDERNPFVVALRTTPFVKRTQELTVKNGELVSHALVNPSPVMGFMSIPIDLGKAIMSIPAQLISLRIDTLKRSKDLETAKYELDQATVKTKDFEASMLRKENELIEAQKKLLKTEAQLNQLKIDAAEEITRLERKIQQLTPPGA